MDRLYKRLQILTSLDVGSCNLSVCAEVDTNELSLLWQIVNRTSLDRHAQICLQFVYCCDYNIIQYLTVLT